MSDARDGSVVLRFARRYGLPYWRWYLVGIAALLVTNGLSVTIPVVLADGIDALALGTQGRPVALRAAVTVAGMGTLIIGIRTLSRLMFFTPGRLIEARIHDDLFRALLRQQPSFYARYPQGDLTARFTSDVNSARLLFGFTVLGVVNTATAAVLASLQLISLSPVLGLLAALPLAVAFAITTVAVERMRSLMRLNQVAVSDLSERALTSFQGVAAVHAFDAQAAMRDHFGVRSAEIRRLSLARARLRVVISPLLSLAATLDVFGALWLGGPGGALDRLTAGEIVAFAAIVAYMVTPLRSLTFTLSVVRQAGVSLERLDDVLSAVPDRPDRPDPLPAPTAAPALSVRNLTYRYPQAPADALRDVSVEVPAGGVLGVFGPTGSGKTTLVRCLLRLENPPEGTVFVDGEDLTRVDLDAWRAHATLVPQRAFLFTESVRDNITLGRSDRPIDAVVAEAQLEVDMAALPSGLDTVVGEAGLTLSGGQRQRVALARGLNRASRLLVLDDVLSAVDPETEALLLGELQRASSTNEGARTIVVVSNRVSALRGADVIVVLDEGRAVDSGTHAALSQRPGLYRDAAERQSEGR